MPVVVDPHDVGMAEAREPTPEYSGDAYESDQEIPRGLWDAMQLFRDARKLRLLLGEEFSRVYEVVKQAEYEEFLEEISPWEREHLLLGV